MFQFPRFASYAMYSHKILTYVSGFPHSEIPDSKGFYYLIWAYRKLIRPSSPLTAKASTVYA